MKKTSLILLIISLVGCGNSYESAKSADSKNPPDIIPQIIFTVEESRYASYVQEQIDLLSEFKGKDLKQSDCFTLRYLGLQMIPLMARGEYVDTPEAKKYAESIETIQFNEENKLIGKALKSLSSSICPLQKQMALGSSKEQINTEFQIDLNYVLSYLEKRKLGAQYGYITWNDSSSSSKEDFKSMLDSVDILLRSSIKKGDSLDSVSKVTNEKIISFSISDFLSEVGKSLWYIERSLQRFDISTVPENLKKNYEKLINKISQIREMPKENIEESLALRDFMIEITSEANQLMELTKDIKIP